MFENRKTGLTHSVVALQEEAQKMQAERDKMLRFRGVRCKCVVQLELLDRCAMH